MIAQLTSIVGYALEGTPLYDPLRRWYSRVFRPEFWQQRRRILEFYRNFLSKGSLVFDIGANNGEHTRCFVALGARVVAVEPLPSCIAKLRRIYPQSKITVVPFAVGASRSSASMQVGAIETLSTLSKEWLNRAKGSPRFKGAVWDRSLDVEVVTLDSLIEEHGMPDFVKIDIEGFEAEALEGLSQMPRFLTFEFNAEYMENTISCLQKRCFPQSARFNYIVGETDMRLALSEWATREELISRLESQFRDTTTQGDVIARRI